jgi:sugar/nucleoside kinase (ribokinase family)
MGFGEDNSKILTDAIENISQFVDIALINRKSFGKVIDSSIIQKCINKGCSKIIITAGKNGALVVTPKQTAFLPAFSIKSIDSCGAGDSFFAATICELANGKKLNESINFAQALTAAKVSKKRHFPSKKEVYQKFPYRKIRAQLKKIIKFRSMSEGCVYLSRL